jgi:peptidoglycan/xylan/chitin deacetylase (PgdA/CDA1 family)
LAWAVGALGVADAILATASRRKPPAFLTVLNYHRVNNPGAAAEMDEGVLDATPEGLDRQLGILRSHFTFISLEGLLRHLEGQPLPPNPALVTFDDGYRDNLTNAVPILRRHGVLATFFIATEYVAKRRLFWWDRISWIVKHAKRRRFTLSVPEAVDVDVELGIDRAARLLHEVVKSHAGLDLEAFLESLARAADAPWSEATEAALVQQNVMHWDDVRALRTAGMSIGSHTRTHRVLSTIPVEELANELSGSRSELEAALGECVQTLAYPVGRPVARIPAIRAAVVDAGYKLAFSYGSGRQGLRSLDPLDVRRFAEDWGETDQALLGRLSLPWLLPRRKAADPRAHVPDS